MVIPTGVCSLRIVDPLLPVSNQLLLDQFVVRKYNASKFGMSEHQLNQPLPRIDRQRSVPKSVSDRLRRQKA